MILREFAKEEESLQKEKCAEVVGVPWEEPVPGRQGIEVKARLDNGELSRKKRDTVFLFLLVRPRKSR
jgi:hypothetical protein